MMPSCGHRMTRSKCIVMLAAGLAAITFMALACGEDNRNHRLAIWDSDTEDWRFVSPEERSSHLSRWLSDGSGLLVAEAEPPAPPGGYLITRRDTSGDVRWEVEGSMEDRQPVAAAGSPDGSEVAVLRDSFVGRERRGFVEIRDAQSGEVRRSSQEWVTQLTAGATPAAADIVWTPGGRLAVISHRGGGFNDLIWLDAADGLIVSSPATDFSEVWAIGSSSTNRVVVFAVDSGGPAHQLLVYDEYGASMPIEIGAGGNIAADFSPDGRRLVVAHDEQVAVIDLQTGETRVIRDARTQGISWGTDGRIAIAWGSKVMSFDEDGSDLETIVSLSGGRTARNPGWSPDGKHLAFIVEPKYRD